MVADRLISRVRRRRSPVTAPNAVVVALGSRSSDALQERVALLTLALPVADVIEVDVEGTKSLVRQARQGAITYLLDVNRATGLAAVQLRRRRLTYVVDTGDDPRALAIAMGASRVVAHSRGFANTGILRGAKVIVCRGWYHQQWLAARTRAPVCWIPDTAPDWMYDCKFPPGDPRTVATFGTMHQPRRGQPVYGWEVVEIVAMSNDLRGIVIGRGPGLDTLRMQAERLGVVGRIEFSDGLSMRELIEKISGARYVTSLQSNDKAGWFRTTGKLPLALAARRVVVATAVGEAARILPEGLTLRPGPPRVLLDQIRRVISAGGPERWEDTAARLSEVYRRSAVADRLANFLMRGSDGA